ncbi:MAG: hypothetical protein AB7E74_20500 [Pirellulales bacterium]
MPPLFPLPLPELPLPELPLPELPLPELPLPDPDPESEPPPVEAFSELETFENVEAVLEPKLRMPAMQTARIRLNITAYSTAVGPSSWRTKSRI